MELEFPRRYDVLDSALGRALRRGKLAAFAPPRRAHAVECEAPGRARDPAAEAVTVAQPVKVPISAQHRFLRHVFGLRRVSEHAERNAIGELRAIREPRVELACERGVEAHCASG